MSQLVVANATQQLERDHATWAAWGAGLDRAQFALREQRLRAHPWAAKTLTSFWWVDASGAPLSSCELFVDEAVVGGQRGLAGTVASVFTEERLRGRGHAAAMLEALRQREASRLLALTLFSEIGEGLYARLGYRAVPAFDLFFPASATKPPRVEWLEGVLPVARPSEALDALVLPLSATRLDWHLERERIYGEALSRPVLPFHGARVGASTITFTAYWKTNELQVLSLDADDEAVPGLFDAARHAAHVAGLPVVRWWETRGLPAFADQRRAPRTDELPMFLPLRAQATAWVKVERGLWA
ncbi:MAG: N-acetyltransferase [Myxococcaceae bacterium]